MGGTSYEYSRSISSRVTNNTYSNSIDQNFTQNKLRKAHDSMRSQGIALREARDSEVHPETFPFILCMDLTGSMGHIPQNLIQDGLPTMISTIIQGGVQSPALLFMGVGDHEVDSEPLQIGQFESGDVELDMWLSRTYLERGGGSNDGESYSLAHYFAARHVVTDAWEKRGVKGVLITIGDEPNLRAYPTRAMKEIMGSNFKGQSFTEASIYEEAKEKWEVFHINPKPNARSWMKVDTKWKALLGQNYIEVDDYKTIPQVVSDLVVKIAQGSAPVEGKEVPSLDSPPGGAETSPGKPDWKDGQVL